MRYVLLGILLTLFWIINSGQLSSHHLFLMGAGVVCIALTMAVSIRLGAVDAESSPLPILPGGFPYGAWLLWQIVKSNIQIAYVVWAPRPKNRTCLFRVPINLRTAWGVTIYANSIIMTPGTVTVEVTDEYLLVHSLTTGTRDDLLGGDMHRAVQRLEGQHGN